MDPDQADKSEVTTALADAVLEEIQQARTHLERMEQSVLAGWMSSEAMQSYQMELQNLRTLMIYL